MKVKHLLIILLLLTINVKAQIISAVSQTRPVSIRGLSVVTDQVAWLSGTKGTVAKTIDGGKTWTWQKVKGFEKADFRDIEAFSDQEAIIMSAGTPALILKTTDGGLTWQAKYHNDDKAYFLDAMSFADHQHGYTLGDPIGNKFLLLETKNGGESWKEMSDAPVALKNEAAFAASGTCLNVNKQINIVTGGNFSRLICSPVKKILWTATFLPLTNGDISCGAFSYAKGNNENIVVGGDYKKIYRTDSVVFVLPRKNTVSSKILPGNISPGFQSCVLYLNYNSYLSTGTSGSNLSTDGGNTWRKISNISYNVCQKAKNGKLIILAGDNRNIGIFKL